MEDVLEVLAFAGLLWVEEFQELLDKGGGDVDLESLDVSTVVDDQLEEEFVDWLEVGPGGID